MQGGIDVETLRYLAGLPFQKINERSILMYSQLTLQKYEVPVSTPGIQHNAA
jgi:hypothetical protein